MTFISSDLIDDNAKEFIRFSFEKNVLRFGEFKIKSGRVSPYFFDLGQFNCGYSIRRLASFYANILLNSQINFDMLFGPAYKGIALATALSIELTNNQSLFISKKNVPFAFNRKEKKNYGEGGMVIGSPLKGKVVIVDDVITSGQSIDDAIKMIYESGAQPAAIVIALDRMERQLLGSSKSTVQLYTHKYNIPIISIASILDVINFLTIEKELIQYKQSILDYQKIYGAL